ncbi:MAG: cytochrome C [Pseudomonadota bacterium]
MRVLASIAVVLLAAGGSWARDAAPASGEAIYRDGVLASGQPLLAMREPDVQMNGADAACVNCHRRSGLGMKEGQSSVPPVSGRYLFQPRATAGDDLDLPFVEGMRADRNPYTDVTLARAIRDGIAADGKPLNYLMPHYPIGDQDMAALIDYLKGMTKLPVPGVSDSVLDFATIITPDADPVKRQGMLDVITQFFADKNAVIKAESPRLHSTKRMMFKTSRHWALHVWELKGAPNTWESQLQQLLKHEPVFAVVSGLGGSNWEPVHRFCEQASLPCLFPNVELPVVAEHDFHSLYFSKGVLLEAGLMAHALRSAPDAHGRIVQLYRDGDVGESAAGALAAALAGVGREILNRPLAAKVGARDMDRALRGLKGDDTLVLWLRPQDLEALFKHPPGATVMSSTLMGGKALTGFPTEWRAVTQLAYPYDLPDRRRVRVDYPLGWMRLRKVPLVSEQVQTDTYLACSLLSDTLNHMADSFIRDYLVERMEEALAHRIVTGYYPHLGLAQNQRFASKGGYIVKFAAPTGAQLAPVGEWLVP